MKYVQFVNSVIKERIKNEEDIVLFGQNIDAGSCLSGLTRGLGKVNNGLTINTPNCENTLVGVGFGLMLNDTSSIFFMKQQDFLLLGIDHLVNTYNIVRQHNPRASFTIFPIIVDSGYEGPQSALNNFNDFCSIGNIDGYSFTNEIDTRKIISKYLIAPGFRILSVSQRLLKQELLKLKVLKYDEMCRYFQYTKGDDVSIVCFNYSLPYAIKMGKVLADNNLSFSLFSVNVYTAFDFSVIINDIKKTKNLIVIDDSKSGNKMNDKFLSEVYSCCELNQKILVSRSVSPDWFFPCDDLLKINYQKIVERFI